MAEPVRNDEPIGSVRFPEPVTRPGPVPVTPVREEDTAGLLPEHATDKPLGEWPRETLEDLRYIRHERLGEGSSLSDVVDSLRQRTRPVAEFLQDRAAELRRRFRIIRGRLESGELREELEERASGLGDEASHRARIARTRAEYYARKNPLQFIAGAAAAGFAIGFLLRMWRDE